MAAFRRAPKREPGEGHVVWLGVSRLLIGYYIRHIDGASNGDSLRNTNTQSNVITLAGYGRIRRDPDGLGIASNPYEAWPMF